MAYKPSQRLHNETVNTELNLMPIMNLMVVLIPLLLSSAQFIKIGIIELNLPPAAGAAGQGGEKPKENYRTLDLVVSVTNEGFYISSSLDTTKSSGSEKNSIENKPLIPVIAVGVYDYNALSEKLHVIKQQAGNIFKDKNSVVIQPAKNINYQVLVSTMDAARYIKMANSKRELFPRVSLSAGVL